MQTIDVVQWKNVATIIALVVIVAIVPEEVFGGPPLVCHPIKIGNAKSLPSGDGPFGSDKDYDRANLVQETLQLLTSETPVIVRMETLRRATIYASRALAGLERAGAYTEQDRRLAFELLSRVLGRALEGMVDGNSSAMAWFDAGYLIECYRQAGIVKGLDGYRFLSKALALRGDDPEIEFACAMATADRNQRTCRAHLDKASAAVREGSLLATNIVLHFGKKPQAN